MKERPILFSGKMVKDILDGRKTQTRRVIEPQPRWKENPGQNDAGEWCGRYQAVSMSENGVECGVEVYTVKPKYRVGDRLWVREGTIVHGSIREQLVGYVADGCRITEGWMKVMPSNHMRRIHSRITLEITNVRVQRLQDIGLEDCLAEGIEVPGRERMLKIGPIKRECDEAHCRAHFWQLWDSVNARKYPWLSNPWVWAISFRRVEQ